ncbi:hypothetical protein P9112_011030 [Eukaryota sp. TZLM1-RC]
MHAVSREKQEFADNLSKFEAIINDLEQKIGEKDEEIATLQAESVELENSQQLDAQLLNQLDLCLKEFQTKFSNISSIQDDNNSFSSKIRALISLAENFNSSMLANSEYISKLEVQISTLDTELSENEHKIEDLQSQLSETSRINSKLNHSINEKAEEIEQLRHEYESLLDKERARNHSLRERITTLTATKESLASSNEDNVSEQKKLRFEVVRLTSSISELYSKVIQLERSNNSLTQLLTEERNNNQSLVNRIDSLKTSKDRILAYCEECTVDVENKTMTIEDLRGRISSLEDQLKRNAKFEPKYNELEQEYHNVFVKLESTTSHVKILSSQIMDLKSQVQALEALRGESEATIAVLRRRLEGSKEELQSKEDLIGDLRDQLSQLRGSLRSVNSSSSSPQEFSSPLVLELRSARQRISELESAVKTANHSPLQLSPSGNFEYLNSERLSRSSPRHRFTPSSNDSDVAQLQSRVRELQRTNLSLEKATRTPNRTPGNPSFYPKEMSSPSVFHSPSLILPKPHPIPLSEKSSSSQRRDQTVFYDIVNKLKEEKMKELEDNFP